MKHSIRCSSFLPQDFFRTFCVIVPTYNRSHFISQAVDSVLCQSYRDFFIIIVDDGSTDDTELAVRRYDDRVQYVKQQRGGPGKARNTGLNLSLNHCRYIAFLDSDDLWHKSKLELQVRIMEAIEDVGFLFSDFGVLKERGEVRHDGLKGWNQKVTDWETIFPNVKPFSSIVFQGDFLEEDFSLYWGDLYGWLLKDPYVLPSSAVIRHECVENGFRFPEGVYLYEDWDFFARIARQWPGCLMDTETTLNRGHDGDERLTRCSTLVAAESRLSMIERVWCADVGFMEVQSEIVQSVKAEQLLIMAKELFFQGESFKAQEALKKWRQLKSRKYLIKAYAILALSYVPWSEKQIKLLRKLVRIVKSFPRHVSLCLK